MRILVLVFMLSIHAVAAIAQDTRLLADQAAYLAGMLGNGSVPRQGVGWTEHRVAMQRAWDSLDDRQMEPLAKWRPGLVNQADACNRPLYYFFSGPDFLYADALFPDLPVYVLCGMEPIGQVPDLSQLSNTDLTQALRGLRKSLNSSLNFSFFITMDMAKDLTSTQLSGVLPLLYVSLARRGCMISEVQHVGLDARGRFVTDTSTAATHGVRIAFQRGEGRRQFLYYFTSDLSNSGIKESPGFIEFCRSLGPGHALLKAASYLLHTTRFSDARNFITENAQSIIQDDSGLRFKTLNEAGFDIHAYGRYPGPIPLFAEYHQKDLAKLFGPHEAPLPFSFGYRWQKRESSLIHAVARPKKPKTRPPTLVSR
jgi:hypothetical protein